jgi:aspartyl-tRNA(Asn)/glutamyl-tRNA(Gln) amidotransferase subunit A
VTSVANALTTADRIERSRARGVNAVLAYDRPTFIRQAEARLRGSGSGALEGVPVGVKDNICTLEYPTTCASKMLRGYGSPFEATAVSRLKAAGALIACKTNLDEFAMGASTEYSAFGPTRNPLAFDRVPGGSSGGSAALVAEGAVDIALGSETGGSVRQPASFCGVVGIKPTFGRVSRYGLVAFGSSLDQIGVFGRTVDHAARALTVISGRDPCDSTSADLDPLELPTAPSTLAGVAIGVPREFFPPDLDPAIRTGCDRALEALRSAGAEVRSVSLPHTGLAIPAYYVIAPAEASSNLARFDGVRFGTRANGPFPDVTSMYRATRGAGFGPEVRRRIIIGTYVLSAGYYGRYYQRAQRARRLITADYEQVFRTPTKPGIDLLFTPTTPTRAFAAGEKVKDPVSMYLADIFICTANLARLPAMSIPIGRAEGLPIGGQLIGPAFSEASMIDVARHLERLIDGTREVQ